MTHNNHEMKGEGAVPDGFTLPWNTTRTMADVFREQDLADRRMILASAPVEVRMAPKSKERRPPVRMGRPPLQNFRLHDWQGSFLHESCLGMTKDERQAWKGNAKQLAAVRERFPNTVYLIASEVA